MKGRIRSRPGRVMEKVGEDLEDSEKNHSSDDDIYIMMKCVSVCHEK